MKTNQHYTYYTLGTRDENGEYGELLPILVPSRQGVITLRSIEGVKMCIVVAGAGVTGYQLIRMLVANKHDVVVIEDKSPGLRRSLCGNGSHAPLMEA